MAILKNYGCSCSQHSTIEITIDATHPIVKPTLIHKSSAKNVFDKELEVNLEDKLYPDTYYNHKPSQV